LLPVVLGLVINSPPTFVNASVVAVEALTVVPLVTRTIRSDGYAATAVAATAFRVTVEAVNVPGTVVPDGNTT